MNEKPLHLIWTQDTVQLTNDIREKIEEELKQTITSQIDYYNEFANQETTWDLGASVRNHHVYVICDVNGNWKSPKYKWEIIKYNDRLIQALLLWRNVKGHWAATLNYIFTCLPYSRQDKDPEPGMEKNTERQADSAHFMLDIITDELTPDYYITLDVHNKSVLKNRGTTKFVNLYTWWFVKLVMDEINKDEIVLCPMDEWWKKKIEAISRDLHIDHLITLKKRPTKGQNEVEETNVYGDIEGKDVLIHDDIFDTWTSLKNLLEKIREKHPRSVNIAITHGMFNKKFDKNWKVIDPIEIFTELHKKWMFENIYVTDTVNRQGLPDFVKTMSSSSIFANTVLSIFRPGKEGINYNAWS